MLENFYQKYIELNLADFFDIGFDFKINKVLFFAFLGIIVACIFTNYIESGISLTLKRLLRTESHSEQSAKTLSELGLKNSKCVRLAIGRRGGMTARLIRISGERALTYEECIAEEKRLREEKKKIRKARLDKLLSVFKRNKNTRKDTATDTHSTDEATALTEEQSGANTASVIANSSTADTTARSLTEDASARASLDETSANTEGDAKSGDNTSVDTNRGGKDTQDGIAEEKSYYIPEDMADSAKRYLSRHAPTVTKTVLSCLLILGFYLLLAYLMPTFIDLVLALT
ncbi:MAG: hypothetical protein IJF38_01675 [Clostridia bacterium]|nr:hypothetical protein [Clostridia bacterium]